jgi:Ca2+-binding RTX toxin-like protein
MTGGGADIIGIDGETGSLWRPNGYTVDAGAGDDRITVDLDDCWSWLATRARTTLDGGAGNDTIRGADSTDTIDGGADSDVMAGGGGRDVFILRAGEIDGDIIQDFGGRFAFFERDQLRFEGFAEDAVLANAGGDDWTIGGETFELTGITHLRQIDYAVI